MARTVVKKYHSNGQLRSIIYRKKNKIRREDGPAIIRYNYDGDIQDEEYYKMGKLHREDGPAMYYPNVSPNSSNSWYRPRYYINGKLLSEAEFKPIYREYTLNILLKE